METKQGGSAGGAEQVAKDFWARRPRRAAQGRKIAGVAAGIGNHYRIDPVIVRVVLVVTALFGGAGVLLYLLGWLLLPAEGDEVSALEALVGRGRSSVSGLFTILLCVALIPASSWFFGGSWLFGRGLSGFFGLVLLVGGLYLLQRHRGGRVGTSAQQAGTGAAAGATPDAGTAGAGGAAASGSAAEGTTERTTPPDWDPLGAAPFAWDLPEPSPAPAPPPAPRRKSRIGLVGVGIALVTVAACVALAPLTGGWMTPAHGIGITLAAVGLTMVYGAYSHGGRGLAALALVLAIAGVIASTAPLDRDEFRGGIGNQSYAPMTVAGVQDVYRSTVGNLELDLSALPPTANTVTTTVDGTFGNVEVTVPGREDATVVLHCHSTTGNIDCLGQHRDGIRNDVTITEGSGPLVINLDVSTKAGNVEVHRD